MIRSFAVAVLLMLTGCGVGGSESESGLVQSDGSPGAYKVVLGDAQGAEVDVAEGHISVQSEGVSAFNMASPKTCTFSGSGCTVSVTCEGGRCAGNLVTCTASCY